MQRSHRSISGKAGHNATHQFQVLRVRAYRHLRLQFENGSPERFGRFTLLQYLVFKGGRLCIRKWSRGFFIQ